MESSGAVLQETIINVKTVQSFNGQNHFLLKFCNYLSDARKYAFKGYISQAIFDGINFIFIYIFYAVGIYYGGILYYYKEVEAGDVFIVTNLLMSGTYFLGMLSPHFMAVFNARVSAAVLYKQIRHEPEIDSSCSDGIRIKNPKGMVEFRNVGFEYRVKQPVLKNVSWVINPGEKVALVGKSGCGKSTSVSSLSTL